MVMKGIILAGGSGTRLYPITKGVTKQLLPIYDKPMIYYPLSTLMLAGIREILIITDSYHLQAFKNLLSDGKYLGIEISYEVQIKPNGIAEALLIGEKFLNGSPCALILGDNFFYGNDLINIIKKNKNDFKGAKIFAYKVNDPREYGVVEFDSQKRVISIEEKPKKPKSAYVITGLYFYDATVVEKVKTLNFSDRGELEITDLNILYLKEELLFTEIFGRGIVWLDTGSVDDLHEAAAFVRTIEKRQGLKICCPEEISWTNKWIDNEQLYQLATRNNNSYGNFLLKLLESNRVLKD
tara:strand:- start:484 stop:1371 length:888 start_codon:yes stop_codon:yes gene_type:complete